MKVTLTNGVVSQIDPEDLNLFESASWYANCHNRVVSTKLRAFFHRLVMNAKPGQEVDHINRDPLDNRKCNLRICGHNQNHMNRGKNPGSLAKGVRFRYGKFRAQIKVNGRSISLGGFKTLNEAADAYDKAAIKYFGEWACTNQKLKGEATEPQARSLGKADCPQCGTPFEKRDVQQKYCSISCRVRFRNGRQS